MNNAQIHQELLTLSVNFGFGEECIIATLPLDRLLRKVTCDLKANDYLIGLESFELWLFVEGLHPNESPKQSVVHFYQKWLETTGSEDINVEVESGPRRLATGRNPPRLIIDLCISRQDYEGVSKEIFRQKFADGVQECFKLMLARALKKKAVKDEAKLRADFGAAMQRFRTEPIPPYVPLGTVQLL